MDIFDLQAFGRLDMTNMPPAGHEAGRVRIDDLDETIFFNTKLWSAEDYRQHWQDAAKDLADGADSAIFCTDLNMDNASMFVGFRAMDCVWFEQWVLLRSAFTLDGIHVTPITPAVRSEEGEVSCWQVSIDAVRTYPGS